MYLSIYYTTTVNKLTNHSFFFVLTARSNPALIFFARPIGRKCPRILMQDCGGCSVDGKIVFLARPSRSRKAKNLFLPSTEPIIFNVFCLVKIFPDNGSLY